MSTPLRVLIVEDSPDEAELLILALESEGYQVAAYRVDSAAAMTAALEAQTWDIILCDYSMPQFDAIRALRLLQAKQLDLPFIMVSGTVGEETAVAAMKAGVHDYLMKDNLTRLAPAVDRELKEAIVRAERRQALEQLRHYAYYDPLTGLANQTLLLTWIQVCIAQPDTPFALLYLDIDHYKTVKYGLGHALAEELLIAIADRLKTSLCRKDPIARVATDGFAILIRNSTVTAVEQIIQQIHATITEPFDLSGAMVATSGSIGVIYSEIGYSQAEDYLRAADTAMHEAKLCAKGSTIAFNIEMQTRTQARLQLETDLRQAIERQQFFLVYQPIVSLETGLPTGFEALIRWNHPTRGFVSPLDFIPLAEETRQILSLGQWVLRQACQQLQRLRSCYPTYSLSVNVNLSGVQLEACDLVAQIDRVLHETELSGECLKVEITESVLMKNAAAAIALLNQLHQRQITVCIDDFGTGYSSLSYLRQLPINTLKIDQSFVGNLDSDPKNLDIVRAIITLAQSLGMDIVAEGVETTTQLAILKRLGCQSVQGYLFSKPIVGEKLDGWLESFTREQLFSGTGL